MKAKAKLSQTQQQKNKKNEKIYKNKQKTPKIFQKGGACGKSKENINKREKSCFQTPA